MRNTVKPVTSAVRAVVGLGLCAVLVSSCSSSTSSSPASTTSSSATSQSTTTVPDTTSTTTPAIDPCSLVTQDEATTLAGTPVGAGDAEGADGTKTSCTYGTDPNGPTAQVQVFVGDGAKNILDDDRAAGHTLTPVPGIGDEAYVEDGYIFVRKGSTWVAINLLSVRDDSSQDVAPLEAQATTIVSRLP